MKSISISVPFVYEALIRLRRQRMPVTIPILDVVDVSIRAGGHEDFPVALSILRHGAGSDVLLADRGRLLQPVVIAGEDGEAREILLEALVDNPLQDGSPFARFWAYGCHFRNGKPCSPEASDIHKAVPRRNIIVQEWLKDNRNQVVEAAATVAEQLVFCHGVLHRVVPEPVWHICERPHGDFPVSLTVACGDIPVQDGRYFHISRLEEAVEAARELAKKRGHTSSQSAIPADHVEILMDDLISQPASDRVMAVA